MNEQGTETSPWRPIATAPKDRNPILCRVRYEWHDGFDIASWAPGLDKWVLNGRDKGTPTHWMPIPEFPK